MAKKSVALKEKRNSKEFDPIFVPVLYGAYRKNKINLLNAQIGVLGGITRINAIRELQKQKGEVKSELYRRLSELMKIYSQFRASMPPINNPSFMKKVEKTIEVAVSYHSADSSFSFSKKVSQIDELDTELREIQAKLNNLNSSKEVI